MSKTNMNVPASASAYDDAMQSLAGGRFISRFKDQARRMFATIYGSPFYAISRLAPEVYTKPSVNLLFADAGGWYAEAGGRWLTLYAKALQPGHKHAITVCTSRRPEYKKAPRPILIQPPQQVLLKSWDRHLQDLDALPDLTVLPVPDDFEHMVALADLLRMIIAGHKVLISCHLHAEAILVGALLHAFGFTTSEVVGFDLAKDKPQHLAQAAWWLSVVVPTEEHATQPSDETIGALGQAHQCLRNQVGQGNGKEEAALIAAKIASRATVSVDGKDVHAVCIPPIGGIDIESGRFFNVSGEAENVHRVWDTRATDMELLGRVPTKDKSHSDDEDRLNLMLWVAKVLAELDKREPEEPPVNSTVPAVDQETAVDAEPAVPKDRPVTDSATAVSSEVVSDAVPVVQPQRPRLSRRAGAVNVLALAAQLGRGEEYAEKTFDKTRARILRWLKGKGFRATDPLGNNHIESPDGEVTIESDGSRIWSLRFDDRRSMMQGAIWRVEVTLVNGDHPAMGLRLIQVRSSEDAPPPIASGVPQVVADIAKSIGLMDAGTALLNTVVRLSGAEDASRLIRLLLNSDRVQPVVVISGDIDVSAERLAKRLVGVAHIVYIDAPLSHQLIRQLGRERSVYGHAVRLYRPGFNTDSDPYQHPVWPLKEAQLPRWLANDLFEEACATSTVVGNLDERVPPFQVIRKHLATQRLKASEKRLAVLREQVTHAAASKDEKINKLLAIREELEATVAEYQAKFKDFDSQLADLKSELKATQQERDDAREELRQSRYQFHAQWNEESDASEAESADEGYYPDVWDDLEEWVETYGDNKLVLLPQAAKAARESPFKNIPLAYKALDYLVRYYIPMRTRDSADTTPYQASQDALAEFGLELSSVGTALNDRRYKQEYRRQYEGSDIWLDQHLKAGVGFDPATLFRLYFWYDTDANKVVVGHLPTHLTNRTTHSG